MLLCRKVARLWFLYLWKSLTMYRWLILFLLFPLVLIHSRPVTATVVPTRFSQAQSFPFNERTTPLTDHFLATLHELVEKADQIVRGQVTGVQSFWREDLRIIESEVTIAVNYGLLGSALPTLTVRIPGGYLATEGIGMVSRHDAAYAVGEEVLIFIYQIHPQSNEWRMVDGAMGKFSVEGNRIFNHDLALAHTLDDLLPTLVSLVGQRGLQAQVPTAWRYLKSTAQNTPVQPIKVQGSVQKWATPHARAAFYINLNSTQIGDEDGDQNAFRNAIQAAATGWNSVVGADFALTYAGTTNATQTGYNGVNEVLFMSKGPKERAAAAQVWYRANQTIIEADIWINDDFAWNATGTPDATEVDLQSALLHEFGHWLILGHFTDTKAVMFSRLTTGTLKRDLQQPDIRGIRAIYPE
jgi:Matrixin